MTSAKQLIVMRHAKTESFAESDHARVLTQRGKRDSMAAGRWLEEHDFVPDCILVSSAARAQGTVDLLCEGMERRPLVIVLDELYGADEYDVLAICAASIPGDAERALVVGHNPTMALTSWLIQSEESRVDTNFPTSGLAVFEIDVEWNEIDPGVGSFVIAHSPHDA